MKSRIDLAMLILERDEGFEPEPYFCTEKYPTIGHGFRIPGTGRYDPLPKGMRMSHAESMEKLRNVIELHDKTLRNNADTAKSYGAANDVQKAVMLSMVHQLGIYGVLKFKKFIAAMAEQNYPGAAKQALDSLAARQTPNRWKRNAAMIESGNLHDYYT